jgi:signal transduction histidine kinase
VLELSRLDTNKMSLNKEIVDANALLNQVVEFAGDMVRQKGLVLNVSTPETPVIVYADTKRIRQVWLNLIKNAIRFTEQGIITLTISIQPHHAWVDCCVSDTGIGIQPENLSRLFQPFQQLDDSLNRSHDGAGLGLALSKYFVEEHGGNIWIESDPGKGTKVFFNLPLMVKQPRDPGYGRN